MPKIKTHRGAHKRFKFTASGKIKREKAFASHIKSKKKQDRIRKLRKQGLVHKTDEKVIKKLLPGS